ncbi:major facilitator superfamily domain-containing protein [Aspergillus pseudoustus]|uniref:Major facilitator superfamily domain-containing protein n=1 Tax=Aspergillus pseudoustus TaxID=1810923 RepID=A0ABR4JTH2_9EURO
MPTLQQRGKVFEANSHDDKDLGFSHSEAMIEHATFQSNAETPPLIDEAKVLRKMDLHLIPILSLLYLLCFLDRGNIGNAKIEGLLDDLHMTGAQYNMCLTVFFITYSTFELPSNLVLKRLRPSIWLPTIMIGVGVVMTLMGIVRNYHGLLIARIFLGVAEAGLYPGVAFYITMWYCRHEAQLRQAMFFSAASVAGAFSGLLAFGIAKMDGVAGLEGWRWIFILEGILTVCVSIAAFFVISDYPATASFLTEEERAWVIARLRAQYAGNVEVSERFQWRYLWQALSDFQIYLSLIVWYGIVCPLYGVSFFLPSIIKDLGYSSSNAQLLTVPIYVTAAAVAVVSAWLSDRAKQRSPFLLFHLSCIVIGFTIVIASAGKGVPGVVYAGIFLAVSGIYPALPGIVTWLSNNLAGEYKRATGMALQIGIGNFAGAMASNFYRTQDAPSYYLGHSLELGLAVAGLVATICLRFVYQRINKSRSAKGTEGLVAEEIARMGDKSPAFRYIL